MGEKLGLGVVGLGWWGRIMLGTLAASDTVRVAAAADLNPAMKDLAAQHGVDFVTTYEEILKHPGVDAVVLCTPHTQHARQILDAAAAGKHVFCEKPLCLTRKDAVAAVEATRAKGLVLGVGHERRMEPPIAELRRLVTAGTLGTPLQIEANFSQNKFLALPSDNWRLSGREAPAGPMTATGIHLLDLSVSFLGAAESVTASVSTLGSNLVNGDTLGVLVRFKSGANALISAILATPFEGRFAIYGSKGWAEVRDRAHPEASEGWTLTVCDEAGKRTVKDFAAAPTVRLNVEAFANAARGGQPYPMTDAQKIDTVAALEAIVASAATKQTVAVDNG